MAAAKKTVKRTAVKKPASKSTAKKPAAKKPAAKKKPAVKSTTKKTTTKKVTSAPKAPRKISVGSKPYTKSEFITTISEATNVSRKDISQVLSVISDIIGAHLQKQGPAIFSWPGLLKMKVVKKPATKARKGVNPFTGEPTVFKAKPASRKVKILPLKQLKAMADQ
jgi:nucleoid DNA-binding protein